MKFPSQLILGFYIYCNKIYNELELRPLTSDNNCSGGGEVLAR